MQFLKSLSRLERRPFAALSRAMQRGFDDSDMIMLVITGTIQVEGALPKSLKVGCCCRSVAFCRICYSCVVSAI